MHFMVTGHTGFKGAWLIAMLKTLGHQVSGFALPAERGSLFEIANLGQDLRRNTLGDVRDLESLRRAFSEALPDAVIHLAAQPLVLRSYADPLETYTTNVMGTLHFLTASQETSGAPPTLVVTTDKVYLDTGKGFYSETDALGGFDPYSASKAMADILSQSWSSSNPEMRLHIARAGNVIGAYDHSENRLLPDVTRALVAGRALEVRNIRAVRPWQHVLDCLAGYLMFLGASANSETLPVVLNFGPGANENKTVGDVLEVVTREFPQLKVNKASEGVGHETQILSLDSSQARNVLGWTPKIGFEDAVLRSVKPASDNVRRELFAEVEQYLAM